MNLFVYTPIRIGKKEIGHLPGNFFKIFFREMGKGYPRMWPVITIPFHRWAEQWLPHAAWYLPAVAEGE